MGEKGIIIIADYLDEEAMGLPEICEVCNLNTSRLVEFIEYDIIHPQGDLSLPETWAFDLQQLKRLKRALRLQHDLNINLDGVAIVLDLLEQMDNLYEEMHFLEKHYL